jgi:PAS domain S-box-containing protein
MRFHLRTSLRGKTLAIVLATVIGLVGGLYWLSRAVILRGFSNVENQFAQQNLERASSALANELEALQQDTDQYADRDQTYTYLRNANLAALREEFSGPMFYQRRINFLVVLDGAGHPVVSKGFNSAAMTETPIPGSLYNHLRPGSALLARHGSSDVKGIASLSSGPALIVSSSILTSDSAGPPAGTLIMGRFLDADEATRLAAMMHMPVEIGGFDQGEANSDIHAAAEAASAGNTVLIRPYHENTVAAYQALNDIYGKPAAVLRVLLPRQIYDQGRNSLLQFLLLLLAAGLIFGAVTLYLLEKIVISRIAAMSENITAIGASGNLSARTNVTGNDELAYLGSAIDGMLEDLERSQKERHEGQTRLEMMASKIPGMMWTTNTELRTTFCIGAAYQLLGVRPSDRLGKSLFSFFQTRDPEHPPIVAHRRALAGESVTFESQWKDHTFESYLQPLRNSEGEIQGVIGVALDITERKRLTDQLRQSQKMQAVGELAGGVAHDFNNLLMVMKGHAQILIDRLPEESALRQNVLQVEKAADRAASLTRQLLAFSRKQVLQPRVLDMNELVAGMIKMLSRVIGENIEMAFLPGANLDHVKADPGQLEQVLLNLVVNARDAMPNGGRLTIETSNVELDRNYAAKHTSVEQGPYVMLAVTDTGCGMDAETQSHIFEPFFTTKEPGKGTGLGLATVYGVVKQSGGYVYVYSEVGQGTTFKIYMPKVAEEIEKIPYEAQPTKLPAATETILFVEDEQSVRELVRDYLAGAGYQVLEAQDGIQALDVAAAHNGPIHLLITDVVMPHLSGRELAARLASERRDLKLLFISGYTDDTVVRHGVLEGGMAFLQKPFNLKALAQKIRDVLAGQPTAVSS